MIPPWRQEAEALIVAARLTPRGGRDALDGVGADAGGAEYIRARVSAPPVGGAANAALLKLMAWAAGARKGDVSFVSGETARLKRLRIEGDPAALAPPLSRRLGI